MRDYDLIVIGSGPSGRRAAIQAAKLGRSVLVVEKGRRVGGVSVHTGTIPSKTLRETVLNLSGWRERGFYGRSYRVKQDIEAADLMRRMTKTLDHEVEVLEHQFHRNGVRTARGHARFTDPHTIEIAAENGDARKVTAAHVLIACGTRPFRPPHVPFDGATVLDSDEILDIKKLPRSLTVIGAGVIGVEYATIFSALDVAVTLIEPRPTFLDFIDSELIAELTHEFRDRKLTLRLGAAIDTLEIGDNGRVFTKLANGQVSQTEMLLYAAGRVGATEDLGLEHAGLDVDNRGRLSVTAETLQTGVPHIYAAGDVIGFPALAATAMEQGRQAAYHAFGEPVNDSTQVAPYGIYTIPEVSYCGATETELTERAVPYEVGISRYRELARGQIVGDDYGMLKLLVSPTDHALLGVHVFGTSATELVHIGQAIMGCGGTVDYLVDAVLNYPTLSEAYKVAALDATNKIRALDQFV